jgi:arylsulfatase A-like enzyme
MRITFIAIFSLIIFSSYTTKKLPPNVVIIFMDDLGYGDLSCTGALNFQTPILDKMANEGMLFTNFLTAQAVCSASRAALLTGCYPNRIGISAALMPDSKKGINSDETTIAEMLKERGYTTGIYGKWHLGHHKEFLPLQHGFDEYLGLPYSNDMWPVMFDGSPAPEDHWKRKYPILPVIRNNDKIEEIHTLADQAKLTTLFTQNAVNFIKKNKKKPFFLYVPHPMPHVPIAVSEKFKGKSGSGLFGDLMMEIDWSVGEILNALKDSGLEKNTLVIFTSDNGPWLNFGNHAGSSGGFREGKGTSYEGGHRVPTIMQWKGTIPPGVICNQLTATIDILPTIAKVCKATLPKNKIDGLDFSSFLMGNVQKPVRETFYYYYRSNSLEAVRWYNWKLVFPHDGRSYENQLPGNDGFPGLAPENVPSSLALFDLGRDPAERYNVLSQYPAIVSKLQNIAEIAREDLGDDLTQRDGKNVRKCGLIK